MPSVLAAARGSHRPGDGAGSPRSRAEKAPTSALHGTRTTRMETSAERDGSRRVFHLLHHSCGDRVERGAYRVTRIARNQRVGPVAPFAQLTNDRQFPQKWYPQLRGVTRATAVRENLVAMAAFPTQVVAHVFDHAEDRHVDLAEHLDAPFNVEQRQVLRSGDHYSARERDALGDGQLRVAGPGGKVQHQAVEFPPVDIEEKLGFELGHHRSAPDNGGLVVDKQRHRNVTYTKSLDWDDPPLGGKGGRLVHPHHHRQAGPVYVRIHEPDAPSAFVQRQGQVDRHGGFADSALAAGNRDDVLHPGYLALRGAARGARRGCCWLLYTHFHGGHVAHRADRSLYVGHDFLDNFGLGGCHRQHYGHAGVGNLDVFDHAERDDVAAESRVFDFLELG